MAALTITAANVQRSTGATIELGTAGATITAGQPVYLDTADNKLKLADADGATALIRSVYGIALHASLDGQPLTVQKLGDLAFGAILTAGEIYVLGDAPGGIMPKADLGAGDRVFVLGIAKSTTVMGLVMAGFDVGA